MTLLVGHHLGQYKLIDFLGEGGVASVYHARHLDDAHEVAIKVLKPGMFNLRELAKQIKREALISVSLRHPHIVDVFGFGENGDLVYMVMRLLRGGNLAELAQRNSLSLAGIDQILREVASALDYVHKRGIVHRDVKPQNVLIDDLGHACLSDFGMFKALSAAMQDRCKLLDTLWHSTKKGMVVGTPAYMSPEQCKSTPVNARSDTYSLGIVLYELLTGQVPFKGDSSIETMYQHMKQEAPLLSAVKPDLPPGLDAVIQKALNKNPGERYTSAGELAAAFRAAIAPQLAPSPTSGSGTSPLVNQPPVGLFPGLGHHASGSGRRKVLEFIAVAALVLAISVAFAYFLTLSF